MHMIRRLIEWWTQPRRDLERLLRELEAEHRAMHEMLTTLN